MQFQISDRWRTAVIRGRSTQLKDTPAFLLRLSELLGEGYTFAEATKILLPHHVKAVRTVQSEVDDKLRNGEGVLSVLHVLGVPSTYLISIDIAEQNGHMQEALHGIGKQMQFTEKMQGRLKKLLVYPITLLIFILGLFLMFRSYFFPNIERMVESRGGSKEESLALSRFFLYIPDYGIFLFIAIVVAITTFYFILSRKSVAAQIEIHLKIPVWRYFYRMNMTRAFSKYLGGLLLSGFSLQSSLQVLQDQKLQLTLKHCAEQLRARVVHGESLSRALEMLAFFQKDFVTFVEHGEKSGFLGKELVLYSELLDARFEETIQKILGFIQPAFFVLIALCIIGAYLSLLLPIYSMIDLM